MAAEITHSMLRAYCIDNMINSLVETLDRQDKTRPAFCMIRSSRRDSMRAFHSAPWWEIFSKSFDTASEAIKKDGVNIYVSFVVVSLMESSDAIKSELMQYWGMDENAYNGIIRSLGKAKNRIRMMRDDAVFGHDGLKGSKIAADSIIQAINKVIYDERIKG